MAIHNGPVTNDRLFKDEIYINDKLGTRGHLTYLIIEISKEIRKNRGSGILYLERRTEAETKLSELRAQRGAAALDGTIPTPHP